MIIYLAALQGISRSYYEAATVDGASNFVIFRKIKVPLLLPITLFLSITGFIDSFQIFVYSMTNGGPIDTTEVLGFLVYKYGFRYFKLGYASAISLVMFVILMLLTVLQWKFTNGGEASETK